MVATGGRGGLWLVAARVRAGGRGGGGWRSLVVLVLEDDVGAGAVGDDLDDVVAGSPEVGADAVVEGGGVGEVEGDEGEVAAGDVAVERGGVAVAGDVAGGAAGAGA